MEGDNAILQYVREWYFARVCEKIGKDLRDQTRYEVVFHCFRDEMRNCNFFRCSAIDAHARVMWFRESTDYTELVKDGVMAELIMVLRGGIGDGNA